MLEPEIVSAVSCHCEPGQRPAWLEMIKNFGKH
jgi:hypothetical protein